MALHETEVRDIFRAAGALLDGHFILASGKHSAQYLEKFRVFEHPNLTARLCGGIADAARCHFGAFETVAGPTTGGILIAQEVARQLGVRAVYAERDGERPGRVFRRGQRLRKGERVLVVDDIVSTGGSILEAVQAVSRTDAEACGAAVFVDRSGGTVDLGVRLVALWETNIQAFAPHECPLCAEGVPATKPGTTPDVAVPMNLTLKI